MAPRPEGPTFSTARRVIRTEAAALRQLLDGAGAEPFPLPSS
jgi:hypothetical protein